MRSWHFARLLHIALLLLVACTCYLKHNMCCTAQKVCAYELLAHVFGPSSLTSCHDMIAYDDVLRMLTVSVLPDLPPTLKA